MGTTNFNVIQYGAEGTSGNAVAADRIWPGMAPNNLKIGTDVKPKFIREMNNVRVAERRVVNYQKLYENNLMTEDTTFQQLLFPLSCGLKGGVTAVEQTTSQTDYLWDFTPSLTATANEPESATIELADDVQAWETEYCMFREININGTISQDGGDAAVSCDMPFFGRKLTETTKTPALALSTGELMNAKLARLYLDTAWSGVGGTELANLLRGFQIKIMTGVHPDATGSAVDTFNSHKEGEIAVMGVFTIEAGSDANDILGYMQTPTFMVARLAINGTQIGSGDPHNLTVDIGGYFEAVGAIDGEDRNDNLASFSAHGTYDATGAKMLGLTLTTDVNAWS